MRLRSIMPLSAALLASAGCATTAATNHELARASIADASGRAIGSALISDRAGIVTLTVQVTGLKPGPHGIHLHAVGQCVAPTFASAGGHLNPGMHQHGVQNPAGSHLGDLPNIAVAADGAGAATIMLPGQWAELSPHIFDTDGTAVVIHAGPDDYRSDPAGNSGGRIACGVLSPA
ncbi:MULTISPECIES: superoxide dismutase family protein [Novosphingobium]|uniref:superoxide dismutase family protein n=1 Tax=Novosphingobium TaxID=165696 RepID=UPI001CD4BF63|nr:superoxide dismutase family protein [Novosphingobium percolationis]MCH7629034.1 superoxide dismutase family protein [Pseudomonadota bacterium]